MSTPPPPFLAQFGERSSENAYAPLTRVEPDSGLLHRLDSETALIEEILGQNSSVSEPHTDLLSHTIVTATPGDQPDPDFVRSELGTPGNRCGASGLITIVTKVEGEAPDPDLIRGTVTQAFGSGMVTLLTENRPDQPDPDLTRLSDRQQFACDDSEYPLF